MISKREIEIVVEYFEKQNKFKQIEKKFAALKSKFYSEMDKVFDRQGSNLSELKNIKFAFQGNDYIVNKVQQVNIDFDIPKLEKKLGKDIAKDIIDSEYTITDYEGLVSYLKECGVNPRIFKTFISVSKKVNTKRIDDLEELGKIDSSALDGCYSLIKKSPYYTIKAEGQHEWKKQR